MRVMRVHPEPRHRGTPDPIPSVRNDPTAAAAAVAAAAATTTGCTRGGFVILFLLVAAVHYVLIPGTLFHMYAVTDGSTASLVVLWSVFLFVVAINAHQKGCPIIRLEKKLLCMSQCPAASPRTWFGVATAMQALYPPSEFTTRHAYTVYVVLTSAVFALLCYATIARVRECQASRNQDRD